MRSDSPPWIGARERGEAVEALGSSSQWHRKQPARGAGGRARLQRHDRRRRSRRSSSPGRWTEWSSTTTGIHVVDLKTSKTADEGPRGRGQPAAGLYQLAVDAGATDELAPGAQSGGRRAGLAAQRAPSRPRPAPSPVRPEGTTVLRVEQLSEAVRVIGAEEFAATAGKSLRLLRLQAHLPGPGRRRVDPSEGRHDRAARARRAAPGRASSDRQFSRAQLAAITAGLDPPSAIIAGAGSGKTTVMAARVVWLVGHHGIAPERILGLTFTNKAAAELGQRIRASLELLGVDHAEAGWGEATASTYHAFAGTLIAEHGLRLGIEPDLRVVTDASRFQRVARAIESYEGSLEHVTTYVPTLVGHVMALDAELSEHLVTPATCARTTAPSCVRRRRAAGHKVVGRGGQHGAQAHRAEPAGRRLPGGRSTPTGSWTSPTRWRGVPSWPAPGGARGDAREVRRRAARRVPGHLRRAARPAGRACSPGSPVTAVGDPAQGIYGWRGAATGNLEEFLDDFAIDGVPGRRLTLRQTYRCRPEIIGAANDIISAFYEDARSPGASSRWRPASSRAGRSRWRCTRRSPRRSAPWCARSSRSATRRAVPLRSVAILVRVARRER